MWPLLTVFNPVVVLCAPVCAVALSQARARLPVAVLRELFTHTAAGERVTAAGSLVFGLLVTATDGTVFDLAATEAIRARFATPGRRAVPAGAGCHGGGMRHSPGPGCAGRLVPGQ